MGQVEGQVWGQVGGQVGRCAGGYTLVWELHWVCTYTGSTLCCCHHMHRPSPSPPPCTACQTQESKSPLGRVWGCAPPHSSHLLVCTAVSRASGEGGGGGGVGCSQGEGEGEGEGAVKGRVGQREGAK